MPFLWRCPLSLAFRWCRFYNFYHLLYHLAKDTCYPLYQYHFQYFRPLYLPLFDEYAAVVAQSRTRLVIHGLAYKGYHVSFLPLRHTGAAFPQKSVYRHVRVLPNDFLRKYDRNDHTGIVLHRLDCYWISILRFHCQTIY